MLVQAEKYDWERFNRLPEVELADDHVRSNDLLSTALATFAPIFRRHGVCDTWGISLLHKHWPLLQGERPVQEVKLRGDDTEFVTRPRGIDFAKALASSILAVDAMPLELRVVELSADPVVHQANRVLRAKPDFVEAFCRAAVEGGLAESFGLIALKRASTPDAELVEYNFAERVSVLREVVGEEPAGRVIQTSWRFVPDEGGIDCHFRCTSKCTSSSSGHQSGHKSNHGVDT
jgi:hypothetical protein